MEVLSSHTVEAVLGEYENYFASVSNECKCAVDWTFFDTAFFGIGMTTDLFQACGHCWVVQICWHIEWSTFTASSLRIWNSSTGIPSPPLALFIVIHALENGNEGSYPSIYANSESQVGACSVVFKGMIISCSKKAQNIWGLASGFKYRIHGRTPWRLVFHLAVHLHEVHGPVWEGVGPWELRWTI